MLVIKNIPQKYQKLLNRCIRVIIVFIVIGTIVFKDVQNYYANKLLIQTEEWVIKVSETFDNDSLAFWVPTDGIIDRHVTKLAIEDGQIEIVFAPTEEQIVRDAFFFEQALAPESFLLTVAVMASPNACKSGLIFRGNRYGEYYLFLVGKTSYTVELLTRDSGGDLPREAIIPNKNIPNDVGQPLSLSVLAKDDKYYFYINQIYIDKMSDERLDAGRIGFELMVCQGVTSESAFRLDDFILKVPNNSSTQDEAG